MLAERAAARHQVGRLLHEREHLGSRRKELLRTLGQAVYEHDEQGTQAVRAELEELDQAAADREAEMQAVAERARDRIERARLEVQPTRMVEIPGDPGLHPPVTIPEPGPIPIPEPGPVPSPQPGPIPIPEPTPVPSPQPGPIPIPEPTPVPSPPAQAPIAEVREPDDDPDDPARN
jgi:hypothetical protein